MKNSRYKSERREKKKMKYAQGKDWTYLHFLNPSSQRKKQIRQNIKNNLHKNH